MQYSLTLTFSFAPTLVWFFEVESRSQKNRFVVDAKQLVNFPVIYDRVHPFFRPVQLRFRWSCPANPWPLQVQIISMSPKLLLWTLKIRQAGNNSPSKLKLCLMLWGDWLLRSSEFVSKSFRTGRFSNWVSTVSQGCLVSLYFAISFYSRCCATQTFCLKLSIHWLLDVSLSSDWLFW